MLSLVASEFGQQSDRVEGCVVLFNEFGTFLQRLSQNLTALSIIEVFDQVVSKVMQGCREGKAMAEIGNPNSVSDAGVGVMCISTAVRGAHLNVKINAQDLLEDAEVKKILAEAAQMEADTVAQEQAILAIVNGKIKA